MKFTETNLPGVFLIEPKIFSDSRGFFLENYREDLFQQAGINTHFVQDNHSRSEHAVLRGLHYHVSHPLDRLVRVTSGIIFDVTVDIRIGSPTFGQWYGTQLDGEKMRMMYVPYGYAHGFVVLSDYADVLYKCSNYYNPKAEQGIIWNDPDINISWDLSSLKSKLIISDKDKKHERLHQKTQDKLPHY